MKRKFAGFVGVVALFGVALFYLTYIGAFKKDTYDAVARYKRSAINAVVVSLQLPCDRLMNVGMGGYCHVYFEDGFSVWIAPVAEDEWKATYPNDTLPVRCDDTAKLKESNQNLTGWMKKVAKESQLVCTLPMAT